MNLHWWNLWINLFEVNAKKSVLKVTSRLDPKRKEKLKDVLTTLKDNPVPVRIYDVAKLKGYDSIYWIRIGSLRLVYEVSWSDKQITIHKIDERESVYENIWFRTIWKMFMICLKGALTRDFFIWSSKMICTWSQIVRVLQD